MARAVSGRTEEVVVVGAGLAGLATALHLRGAGHEVTVLERLPHPGGLAGRLDVDGHRIDPGPTVLTMPELLEEALAAVGESLADHLQLLPLHPAYRARFHDGSTLDVHTGAAAMEQAVREFAGPREAEGYLRMRLWLKRLYEVERDRFIGSSFDSPLDLPIRDLLALARLGGFRSLSGAVGRFLRDPRLQRVFTFQALYAGVSPADALAAYAVISYMDTVAGVWFPKGGMRAVPQAMADAAHGAGVRFRYGAEVVRLERTGNRVRAVHTQEERFPCDAVVLATGPGPARELLVRPPRRPLRPRWSPSAVVVHLSAEHVAEDQAHHTISFGRAWKRTFREIVRQGRLMSDPSLLLTTPTVTDPGLAPPGRHLQYLLAPCPHLGNSTVDWSRTGPAYAEELVDVLAQRGILPDRTAVTRLSLTTPLDWAAGGQAAGTPFSLAHNVSQTGPFRPGNLPFRDGNIVLAGSGTTPGVGIPPVLISGRLAAERVHGG
ncbi:phytoene desaturase family protein [Crossiella sp. CA-258035]|uniref:phytoene desaturase family protein n=1 Tax=Crossiella sp. CA-258035 TaxID=2981138 RepID=UPI0024BC4EC5|nr:phytoene desaturase family protein [Crossiella sp. CA-258035]WHT16264.1 phytoene desaturase family protein [Crossiella sp. CA-258035]